MNNGPHNDQSTTWKTWVIWSLRPLEKLKLAAQEIGSGHFHQRVQIQRQDEVGELASEFNRMADSIEQRDEALRQQQERLVQTEKMAVIGRMASKISHEVRNPLNALSLNVELLQDDVQSEGAKANLRAISTEIDRLNRVAENYLSLARTPKPNFEQTDSHKLLNHVVNLVSRECQTKDIRLLSELPSTLPQIRVDPSRIEQALLNLVRNAIEATPAGGNVEISAQSGEGHLAITVKDTGVGIASADLPHIYEPFYTTKARGTGLGLAITSEIVHEQGGTIHCKSTPGQGTQFEIQIPLGATG